MAVKEVTIKVMDGHLRCPACSGFLYDAIHAGDRRWTYLYRDSKHCSKCGRDWKITRRNGKCTIYQFPIREDGVVAKGVIV